MSNRFTERAQRVVLLSQEEAKRLNHDYVGTEHVLLGLIALGEGVAAQVLVAFGADLRKVRAAVERITGTGDNVMLLGEIPFTPRAKKVLEFAVEEAAHMGCQYVGTEHLLLGLFREDEGVAARVLTEMGLELKDARIEVENMLGLAKSAPAVPTDPNVNRVPPASDEPTIVRLTSLVLILLRNRMTYNDLELAVEGARSEYGNKQAPLYIACRELAERLLEK